MFPEYLWFVSITIVILLVPDQFNASGNTDTAGTSKILLSFKKRDEVLKLYDTGYYKWEWCTIVIDFLSFFLNKICTKHIAFWCIGKILHHSIS